MNAQLDGRTGRINIVRMPGESGPVLRCSGELSVSTLEALRRELDLLIPMGYPALTLNLSGCTYVDLDGILGVIEAFKRLHDDGRQLLLVASRGAFQTMVGTLNLDWILPTFPTEQAAALALRGGGPVPKGPESWEEARRDTVAVWEHAMAALDESPCMETMATVSGFHPLCHRSEELLQIKSHGEGTRCRLCPLFQALGGRAADVGCQSIRRPLTQALAAGDLGTARRLMARFIQLMRAMPLPAAYAAPAD